MTLDEKIDCLATGPPCRGWASRARRTSRATTASRRAARATGAAATRPRRRSSPRRTASAQRGTPSSCASPRRRGPGGPLSLPEREVRPLGPHRARARTPTSRATRAGGGRRRSTARIRSTSGTLATAFTRGLQGDDPRYWKTAALLKHFLANSNEDGRDELVLQLRRAAVARVLREALRDGRARGRLARDDGRLQRRQRHARARAPDAARDRDEGVGDGRDPLHRRRRAAPAGEATTRPSPTCPQPPRPASRPGINHFLDRHKERGDRGASSAAFSTRPTSTGAARPLPGLDPPGPAGSARARAVRGDRRRRRPRAVEPAARRARSCAR